MNSLLKNIMLTINVFLLTVGLGFLLIVMVYALPTEKMDLHVRESGASLQTEGNYWRMLPNSPYTNLDNYTDSLMLLTAAYDQTETNLFKRAMNNYHITINDATMPESCMLLGSAEDRGYALHQYGRYWHGYLVVLKPLLLFLNIDEIRQLNWLCIMGSAMGIGILLYHRKKLKYLFPYLLAICFMNPGTIANSLQNSTAFLTASVGIILLLLLYAREKFRAHIWLFFMVLGMATSYFDLLTYPVVALGFPLAFWLVLTEGDAVGIRKGLRIWGQLILHSAMWALGYVGMWGAKWVLASLITGQRYVTDALNNILIRSGNVAFGEEFTLTNLYTKLWYYMSISKIWTLTLVFVALCAVALCFSRKRWSAWPLTVAFLLIALYPLLWGIGAKNHTYIHDLFTHRNWGLTILGLSCSLLPLIESIRLKPLKFGKNKGSAKKSEDI